jgi:hypothetical protein
MDILAFFDRFRRPKTPLHRGCWKNTTTHSGDKPFLQKSYANVIPSQILMETDAQKQLWELVHTRPVNWP